jgi:hypothetical protein
MAALSSHDVSTPSRREDGRLVAGAERVWKHADAGAYERAVLTVFVLQGDTAIPSLRL